MNNDSQSVVWPATPTASEDGVLLNPDVWKDLALSFKPYNARVVEYGSQPLPLKL